LTRVEKLASTLSLTSNTAASVFGFFSTSNNSFFAPGKVVATATGTTAPFSAMSGPVRLTSLLSAGAPAPSAFITSARVLASNALAGQAEAACASTGRGSVPTAASSAARRAE
jgi:hypothetical protein